MSAKTTKKYRSKFFRVALEGDTSDGRVIERQHLQEMADTYNPALYGARIWIEHIRSILPDSPFAAQGDVVALKAEEVEIEIGGQKQKKMALFAQIEPTAALVKTVNDLKQKVYTSMELAINFAKTGKAYLTGLAVTDTPASLGTEMLAFAQQHPDANPLKARKQHPDNLFTAASEASIEFEEIDESPSVLEGFFARLESVITGKKPEPKPDPAPTANDKQDFSALVDAMKELGKIQSDQFAQINTRLAAVEASTSQQQTNFNAFKTQLESTPAGQPARPAVTGQSGGAKTDC